MNQIQITYSAKISTMLLIERKKRKTHCALPCLTLSMAVYHILLANSSDTTNFVVMDYQINEVVIIP